MVSWVRRTRCRLCDFAPEEEETLPIEGRRLSALATFVPHLLLLDPGLRRLLSRGDVDHNRMAAPAEAAAPVAARDADEDEDDGDRLRSMKRPRLRAFVGHDHTDHLEEAIAVEIAADTRSHHAKPKQDPGAPASAPVRRTCDERATATLAPDGDADSMAIDEAVIRSISGSVRADQRPRMYSNVLLVGSASGVPGLASRLKERLVQRMQGDEPVDADGESAPPPVEVILSPKGEPEAMSWRGATLVANSEPMHELWIQRLEWLNGGARVLRERLPFFW